MSTIYQTHKMEAKGFDQRLGLDFVRCACGWRCDFNYTKTTAEDLIDTHIKIVVGANAVKHEYLGYLMEREGNTAQCSCGWTKRIKDYQAPRNVWEGHRGNVESAYKKKGRANHKRSRQSSLLKGWERTKADWSKVEPIAVEVFGGVFYNVSSTTD